MEEKGNAGHVLFLHFKSLQFFSVKLSISFLPSYPILFCQAKYFCQGGAKDPPAPPLGTPMSPSPVCAVVVCCMHSIQFVVNFRFSIIRLV